MEIGQLATQVGAALKSHGFMLATAESCTGGWVAEAVTSVAGSSEWFERGFVTYSNQAKQEMLGVSSQTLAEFGAVSEQTAAEMARGALEHSHAQIALSISGIAGPDGGTADKPVGLVCFGWAKTGGALHTSRCYLDGDRQAVRRQAVEFALQGVLELIDE